MVETYLALVEQGRAHFFLGRDNQNGFSIHILLGLPTVENSFLSVEKFGTFPILVETFKKYQIFVQTVETWSEHLNPRGISIKIW